MRSKAMESLAESKARKRASLNHVFKIQKQNSFVSENQLGEKLFVTHPPT